MYNKKNLLLRCLLAPLSLVYGIISSIRNTLFKWKVLPSESFPIPIICVGNISVGGTGKTPMTEYLVRLLKEQYRVATLSRGYKRKTRGFLIATENCTVREVGDEACQIKHKFPDIIVAVDANRRRAIKKLLDLPENEKPELIILDDAMQHRYVLPSLTILLTDFNNPYYDDSLLPLGTLRESHKAVYRADIIIATKCTTVLKPIDIRLLEKNFALFANQRLYFSNIKYHRIEAVFPTMALYPCTLSEIDKNEHIILITGIANPSYLIEILEFNSNKVIVCKFPDHHNFSGSDIKKIDVSMQNIPVANRRIVCTEKDAMRLKDSDFLPEEWKSYLYYIPISMEFLFDKGENFDEGILKHVTSTKNILKRNNAKN